MTVKELIKLLEECDEDAAVLTEAWATNDVYQVRQYSEDDCSYSVVYIGDNLDYIEDDIISAYPIKKNIVARRR